MTQNNFKVKHGLEVPSMDSVYLSDTTTPALRPTLNLDFTKGFDPRITFTRASTATYYDGKTFSTGDENLLTYSNDFTQSVWDKTNTTITANSVIGPDGVTQNASTLNEGDLNAVHKISQTAGRTGVLTLSCYVKAATRIWVRLTIGDDTDNINAWFNLSSGYSNVSFNGTATFYTSSMTDAGNGWYRCVLIGVPSSNPLSIKTAQIAPADAAYSVNYQGTDNYLYIYGAQLESRDAVTPYVETTSTPVSVSFMRLVYAQNNVPRIDYNPITQECKGLLIEEARTNLILGSSSFTTGSNSTRIQNVAIAPDGSLTAAKVLETATTNPKEANKLYSYVAGTVFTASIYAKAGERSAIKFSANFVQMASPTTATFDLLNGTVFDVSGTITANIQSVGNGWYRCSISGTPSVSGNSAFYYTIAVIDYDAGTSTSNHMGDTTKGLYLWGAQVENNLAVSSYIPTDASTVTRSSDFSYLTGSNFTSWYNPSEGSILCEIDDAYGNNGNTLWQFGNGSTDRMFMQRNTTTGGRILVNVGNTGMAYFNNINIAGKSAFAYKLNDFAGVDGNNVLYTDNTGTIPTVANLYIGCYSANQYQLHGHMKRIQYYPKRLSNESIKSLSTR